MARPSWPLLAALLLAFAFGCNINTSGQDRRASAPQAQPGDMALDYITSDTYPSLLVEVDWIKGYAPTREALEKMKAVFAQRLQKAGVTVLEDTEIPAESGRARWSVGDLLALESQFRGNHTDASRGQAVIWVVYVNGESEFDEGTTRALGISYDASSIAVFRSNVGRTTTASAEVVVESMVLVHEGGHLFGLVNNGLPMVNDHEDPENPRHDSNAACIMFHQIETTDVAKLLSPDFKVDFDYQCRLDLYAAGGPEPGAATAPAVTAPRPAGDAPRKPRTFGPIPLTANQ